MFNNIYAGKKVLVTGNTGFKGSWLTVWLLYLQANVYGISKDIPTEPSMFKVLGLEDKIQHNVANINDLEAMKFLIAAIQPDFVFHLAAQPIVSRSYLDPVESIQTNVLGTAHVLEALRLSNHKCTVVMISSDKCYENVEWPYGYRETDHLGGKDPYSASKGACEIIIHTYYHSFFKQSNSNVRLISVRAGNVIGGGDWAEKRLVPDCIRAWSRDETVEIRNPKNTRPWQHVLEPLSGYLRAGQVLYTDIKLNGEPYNFGPQAGQVFTVEDMLKELGIQWGPLKEREKVCINSIHDFHEAGLLKLNCDKALSELQWMPVLNFKLTIELTASWYKNFYSARTVDMLAITYQQIEQYFSYAKEKELLWTQ